MRRSFMVVCVLSLASAGVQAALLGRAALTPGGTDYQAYYDDVLGITWLADANYAKTSGYSVDGRMNWQDAQAWTASLNTAYFLGVSEWRLPTVRDTGEPGCVGFAYSGTDCGYNVELSSEMADMFYSTLGNTGAFDISGSLTGCNLPPSYCLLNKGPFSNLLINPYWSGTEDAANAGRAWYFTFHDGGQWRDGKSGIRNAWAVAPGDFTTQAPVPIPPAVWLFGSALGVMGALRRKIVS